MSKKILYILVFIISLTSLAPNFQGTQFLKIPIVLKHFNQHREMFPHKNITFWSFLKEHYINKVDITKDGHDELPFKGNISIFMPLSIEYFQNIKIENNIDGNFEIKLFNSYFNFFKSFLKFSIWNPPRI